MERAPEVDFGVLRAHLSARVAKELAWPRLKRRAATAVVLRPGGQGPEVLLMRRVARMGDRWSGDISCPGGFQHEGESLLRTAMRETEEEVGVELDDSCLLGALRIRPVAPWNRLADFSVTPFVFVSPDPEQALVPEPKEVQSARWLPMSAIRDPARRTAFWWWWTFAKPLAVPFRVHRVVHEDYDVWGLTLRVLDELGAELESCR